jgi:hypothetical protein
MARQRFGSTPEFKVHDDSVVIQQVAGSTEPLLEFKNHSGTAVMTVHSSGAMTMADGSGVATDTSVRDAQILMYMEVI